MQTSLHHAADGAVLTRYHWPAEHPCCQVVLAHGMAEHMARYDGLARHLNQHGVTVWGQDHRGHGQSTPNLARGHWGSDDGFARVVDDTLALLADARSAQPGLPTLLLGHSMGSFVGRAALLQRPGPFDGVVFSAPGFRQAPLARLMARLARWLGRQHPGEPSRAMRHLVFGTFNLRFLPARTRFDWLSRDPAVVDAYEADPLCGFDCSPQLWQDLFEGIVAMEKREYGSGDLPPKLSVLLAGSHDPVSLGGKACRQLFDAYTRHGVRDIGVKVYPQGRHEIFNETNQQAVWDDLSAWLLRRWVKPGNQGGPAD